MKSDINENIEFVAKLQFQRERVQQPPYTKSLLTGLKQIYHEYCENTSIHGVQYLGQPRPLKEKIFWLCCFFVSIYCCSNLIGSIYMKWNETPVIVSFSEKSTPVWSIPFPAITICSETKRKLTSKGVTYAQFYTNLTQSIHANSEFNTEYLNKSELEEFRTLLHICNTQIIDDGVPILSSQTIDHWKVLDRMLPEFSRYFFYCKWSSHFGECSDLFTKTYTEEGTCFTFNGLKVKDIYREDTFQYNRMSTQNSTETSIFANRTLMWSLEDGYRKDSGVKTYPARVLGAGARAGLFIALQSFKQELDYACRGPVQGFKVLLHSPDDVPLVSKQFVRIPMGKEILIAVKPNMITTSAGIAEYSPLRRQCYLNEERKLKFFKTYTQSNCELECLANFTLIKCGCVKFSMPRLLNTQVCDENKIYCYDKAENDLLLREFREGLLESSLNYRGRTYCNCLPACTSLVYNTEISQGNFDLDEMLLASGDINFVKEYEGSQMSRLSIYFKENQFITSKRSELYGVTDFLANCGGIFGLFMGFSFLSLVEMIYHFTLRLWSNMKRLYKS